MDLLLIFGMIQCVLSVFFIYYLRKPLTIANKILVVFFITIFLNLLLDYIDDGQHKKYLIELVSSIGFSVPILLYIYLKFQIRSEDKFRIIDLHHFLFIPILYVAMVSTNYINNHYVLGDNSIIYLLIDLFAILLLFYYTVKTYRTHLKHLRQLKNVYSYESNRIKLYWVSALLTLFIVLFFVSSYIHRVYDSNTVFRMVFSINMLVVSYCMAILGIWQGKIISTDEDTRYKHSSLKEEETNVLISKVIQHMNDNKPYLENDFNLVELSNQTGIPKHHLTELLNKYLETSFFQFVRKYRVEHIIDLLHKPENKNVKLLYLAFDSGFNSKTSFNRAFKEVTGKTPSDYLNEIHVNN